MAAAVKAEKHAVILLRDFDLAYPGSLAGGE